MIYDGSIDQAINLPQTGLGSLAQNDVRKHVMPSQGYQNALMGLGGYSALSRLSRGGGLMSALGSVGGLHAAGMADATFNPAAAIAQTKVDTRWLGNARLNDAFEQPYSFRRVPRMFKRSSDKHSSVTGILNAIGREISYSGIDALLSSWAAKNRGVLPYYLGRNHLIDAARINPGRTARRAVDTLTANKIDARTDADIVKDFKQDVEDKLRFEKENYDNPWGVRSLVQNPLGLFINTSTPLSRPFDPVLNPLWKDVGGAGQDAYYRRTRLMRDLHTKGLRKALGQEHNRRELEVLARAAGEKALPIFAGTAGLGAAVTGASAVGQALTDKQSEVNLSELPVETVKFSSAQSHQLQSALTAAQVHQAAVEGRYVFASRGKDGVKESSEKVVISSPLEKRSNLGAVLREMQGQTPYPIPGISTPGILSDAWSKRPEWMGGPSKTERLLGAVKDLVVRDELVFNASGVPVGRKKVLLPGMSGKMLRIPLALGGLMAINAGYNAWQDRKREAQKDDRFAKAIGELRNNEGVFGGFADALTPPSPDELAEMTSEEVEDRKTEMRRARDLTRTSFDILDKYAPTVAENPQLAAGYMQGFLFGGGDNMGVMSPDQYMAQVQNAVQLQNSIDQRQGSSLFDGLGSMVGRLIDPE